MTARARGAGLAPDAAPTRSPASDAPPLVVGLVRTVLALQNGALALTRAALFGRAQRKADRGASEPHRILIYRSGRLGDFVNAIPAIRAIRRAFPKAHIALVTTTSTRRDMMAAAAVSTVGDTRVPWLGFVHPSVVDAVHQLPAGDPRAALATFRSLIPGVAPDVVFLLPYAQEGALPKLRKLFFLRGAGIRCAVYGVRIRQNRGYLAASQYAAGMFDHQVMACMHAAAEHPMLAGLREHDARMALAIDDDARAWADDWARRTVAPGERLVAIFPGGTFPHKRWPVERFAALAAALRARFPGTRFAVVGGATDVEAARAVVAGLGGDAIDLAGQLSVQQLAALFTRCALFVGNDSGPAHVASAAGCPTVSILSAIEYPTSWEPWNSRTLAVRARVPCEYCYSYERCPTGTLACTREIGVEQVAAACATGFEASLRDRGAAP
jgi:ADP-heptose:LPS heptosyltransferase